MSINKPKKKVGLPDNPNAYLNPGSNVSAPLATAMAVSFVAAGAGAILTANTFMQEGSDTLDKGVTAGITAVALAAGIGLAVKGSIDANAKYKEMAQRAYMEYCAGESLGKQYLSGIVVERQKFVAAIDSLEIPQAQKDSLKKKYLESQSAFDNQ